MIPVPIPVPQHVVERLRGRHVNFNSETGQFTIDRLERRCGECHADRHEKCEGMHYAPLGSVPCDCDCPKARRKTGRPMISNEVIPCDDPRHPNYRRHLEALISAGKKGGQSGKSRRGGPRLPTGQPKRARPAA